MTPAEQMREAAAQDVDCACAVHDVVLKATTRMERGSLCGQPICGAEQARSIRALPLPADPVRYALVGALRKMVYESTHLSAQYADGSHWAKISKDGLDEARAALKLAGEAP